MTAGRPISANSTLPKSPADTLHRFRRTAAQIKLLSDKCHRFRFVSSPLAIASWCLSLPFHSRLKIRLGSFCMADPSFELVSDTAAAAAFSCRRFLFLSLAEWRSACQAWDGRWDGIKKEKLKASFRVNSIPIPNNSMPCGRMRNMGLGHESWVR